MAIKNSGKDKTGEEGGLKDFSTMATMMTGLMSKIQNMEKNIDNDGQDSELMLKEMLSEVEGITRAVEGQVKDISNSIDENENIPQGEKDRYRSLTQNIGQLTKVLSTMDSDPEKSEKTLNDVMGYFKKDINTLSGDNDDIFQSDNENRISRLEAKVSRLDQKLDKLMDIVGKLSKKLQRAIESKEG